MLSTNYDIIRQNAKKNTFFFRTDENGLQIYIHNQYILVKILLNIELKRL